MKTPTQIHVEFARRCSWNKSYRYHSDVWNKWHTWQIAWLCAMYAVRDPTVPREKILIYTLPNGKQA